MRTLQLPLLAAAAILMVFTVAMRQGTPAGPVAPATVPALAVPAPAPPAPAVAPGLRLAPRTGAVVGLAATRLAPRTRSVIRSAAPRPDRPLTRAPRTLSVISL